MRMRGILTVLTALLLAATLAFIWGNSLESVKVSGTKSGTVLHLIAPVLEPVVGAGNVTDHLVRKIAHFTEFGALGCELAVLAVLRGRVRLQSVVNCLSAGLAAAVTDESLQLLSGRGAQVSDVLLDLCGVVAGIAFLLLIYRVSRISGDPSRKT